MEVLEFIFKSFWHFIGSLIFISLFLQFAFLFWNRFLRHFNIRKHGYPPEWCDADGDFKESKDA